MLPATHPELLPRPGDTWRYRVRDQFRLGDLYLTARVDEVGVEGVAEKWTTTSDAQVRSVRVETAPGFNVLPGWTLAPPEFAPYLQAAAALVRGAQLGPLHRTVDDVTVPLAASIEGEEEVTVQAGRFRATKLVLTGEAQARSRGAQKGAVVRTEQVVWYAAEVKRIVKQTVSTHVGSALRESTAFELVEATLH